MGQNVIVSPDETIQVIVHIPVKSSKGIGGISIKRIKHTIKVGKRGALDIKRMWN